MLSFTYTVHTPIRYQINKPKSQCVFHSLFEKTHFIGFRSPAQSKIIRDDETKTLEITLYDVLL